MSLLLGVFVLSLGQDETTAPPQDITKARIEVCEISRPL